MESLTNKQLNTRIDSFLARKHQQYPKLSLRLDENHPIPTRIVVTDASFDAMSGAKATAYAQNDRPSLIIQRLRSLWG